MGLSRKYERRRFRGLLLFVLCLAFTSAHARINVVTLPERDTVQLTIYNSVDLTLVKETRHLTFRKGLNKLEFSWANTLIDPTSVEFKALTHADEVEVMDVSFPPRVTNTLEWRINSETSGEVSVEIRYFTSGIRWAAEYLAEAAQNEKTMSLLGHVRVTNNSGEDYENAQVRLVVGVIRLVEEIAQLAQEAQKDKKEALAVRLLGRTENEFKKSVSLADFSGGFGEGRFQVKAKEIIKEGLSEYFLYTVEGKDTIPNTWSKRLPSFNAAGVPVISYYKYEKEFYGEDVRRFYRFTNSTPSKLGAEPLPDGSLYALKFASPDQLYGFVGRTAVKYIPVNEAVELDLGRDQEVLVQPTLVNWEKTALQFDNQGNVVGWTIKETWKFEVQNSKEIDVVIDIRRNLPGDWSLESQSNYEKMDAHKIKFLVPLQAKQKQTLTYQTTTRFGTNVRK
jgi:hypothetical protein